MNDEGSDQHKASASSSTDQASRGAQKKRYKEEKRLAEDLTDAVQNITASLEDTIRTGSESAKKQAAEQKKKMNEFLKQIPQPSSNNDARLMYLHKEIVRLFSERIKFEAQISHVKGICEGAFKANKQLSNDFDKSTQGLKSELEGLTAQSIILQQANESIMRQNDALLSDLSRMRMKLQQTADELNVIKERERQQAEELMRIKRNELRSELELLKQLRADLKALAGGSDGATSVSTLHTISAAQGDATASVSSSATRSQANEDAVQGSTSSLYELD